jgi:plasmid stability protein
MKVTIDLTAELYRAVKVEAARSDRSVRDIVDEALEAWLDAAETREDRASAEAALAEYRRDGGEVAESFFGSLAAETQARYGPDEE